MHKPSRFRKIASRFSQIVGDCHRPGRSAKRRSRLPRFGRVLPMFCRLWIPIPKLCSSSARPRLTRMLYLAAKPPTPPQTPATE